jgi:hypothetical protein
MKNAFPFVVSVFTRMIEQFACKKVCVHCRWGEGKGMGWGRGSDGAANFLPYKELTSGGRVTKNTRRLLSLANTRGILQGFYVAKPSTQLYSVYSVAENDQL